MEVRSCSADCTDMYYCAWTDWIRVGGCSATCGASNRVRSRQLSMHRLAGAGSSQSSDWPEGSFLFFSKKISTCAGTQVENIHCPLILCQEPSKEAAGCRFGPWREWSQPMAAQLCERTRVVAVSAAPGGPLCSGPLAQTKSCPVAVRDHACSVSPWTAWSECTHAEGQFFRDRLILRPVAGDGRCNIPLRETGPCSSRQPPAVIPCKFEAWDAWTACSATCGASAMRKRSRRIGTRSSGGGAACHGETQEIAPCGLQDCSESSFQVCTMTAWEAWSACAEDLQRFRERQVDVPAVGGGQPCVAALEETEACLVSKIDCQVSKWTDWTSCNVQCGGGQMQRDRMIVQSPKGTDVACLSSLQETTGCNFHSCGINLDCMVEDWTPWGMCSATCGSGQQTRARFVARLALDGGKGCNTSLSEARACFMTECKLVDCAWGSWRPWTSCSRDCGGGQRSRDRIVETPPSPGGLACAAVSAQEFGACNTRPCRGICLDGQWGAWIEWQPCSASCRGGQSWRMRVVTRMANFCGRPPVGDERESRLCEEVTSCEPDADCRMSTWSSWSACTKSCSGVKRRSRFVLVIGRGKGQLCHTGTEEILPCNPGDGENSFVNCTYAPQVDCDMGQWQNWGPCSSKCGGGQHGRYRYILVFPENGGKGCGGDLSQTAPCNTQNCSFACVKKDCNWSAWGQWSLCEGCGGKRTRYRRVLVSPECGGSSCNSEVATEVSPCQRQCHDITYCAWAPWQAWSLCSTTCGHGIRSRNRSLRLADANDVRLLEAADLQQKFQLLEERTAARELERKKSFGGAFLGGFCSIALVASVWRWLGPSSSRRAMADDGGLGSRVAVGANSGANGRAGIYFDRRPVLPEDDPHDPEQAPFIILE
eukprot:TRINITY_DN40760_c0_g1_i1.p1 TRINITY_DN40760_c0_g1~~TRINITY_DN40760_c0_g1_i1.p1  ORF type:complete len:943 (-),score=114.89 TRINITY_DN40760_c0_g1_i1:221-2857(-)